MKKIMTVVLSVVMLMSCFGMIAQAKVGDVVGTALNTDIVVYINHYAIPSYAVNGQSVVVAEDLQNFGFDVFWNQYDRSLTITRNGSTEVTAMEVCKEDAPGTKFTDILATDIKVYAGNKRITSYAMNGYTMVPVEELTMFGDVHWVPNERALKMWVSDLHANNVMQEVSYWKEPMLTMDMQEIYVFPSEVPAYQAAGWYTYGDFVTAWANKLANEQGYAAAAEYLETKIYGEDFGTLYATDEHVELLLKYYRLLYRQVGVPIVVKDTYVDYDSSGNPQANLVLWNISNKNIEAFELEFTCMNAYGEITYDYNYYDAIISGYTDFAELTWGDTVTYTWTIDDCSRMRKVGNVYIEKVAFDDGTTWFR